MKTHAVKIKLQPEGIETGWAPLGSHHIGNGFGMAVGAKAGDQMVVAFIDGDHNNPVVVSRIYSDQQKPPEVEGGEMVLFHETGGKLFFDKDGGITVRHKSGGSLVWDKDGKVSLDTKDKDVTINSGSGSQTFSADSQTFTAKTVNMKGKVNVDGALNASSGLTLDNQPVRTV